MKLFDPHVINGKLPIDNHIMMPPVLTRLATMEGQVTEALIDRYMMYAGGGVGIIVTESISVKNQNSGRMMRLNEDKFIPGLKALTSRVHGETSAKIGTQLIHFLKISRSGYWQKVEDLSKEEVHEIPNFFAQAAERARIAGFDAVELHFAHAYTMSSFLSRHNHRKDDYGGSMINRLRLAVEVVDATRKAVGEDFVLGARINGDEFTIGGNSLEQSKQIARRLAGLGLDYISVSAGGKFEDAVLKIGEPLNPYSGYSGHRTIPPLWMPEKVNAHLAAAIKKEVNNAGFNPAIVSAGRIPSAFVAENILQNDEADLVAVARPIVCDPNWPKKSREGREIDMLWCIYCNRCREAQAAFEEVSCFQWKKKNGTIEPPAP
ncbi:MAG: NADH:flavin oxidoreductase [Desulfobacterales bacterium]|nr:NADH:flavin oxidoreductase [Desulfobacterales bacterium]